MAKMDTLTDTFGSADGAKWTGFGGSVAVTGGQLVISATFSGVSSTATDWDATNSSIYVQVINGGQLQITNAADDRVLMFVDTGSLFLQIYQGGVFSFSDNIAYSTTTHAWWRIGLSGSSTVLADTAPDGTTWTNRWTQGITPAGNYATTTTIGLRSGGAQPVTYDNFNTLGGGGGGSATPGPRVPTRPAVVRSSVW